MFNNMHLRRLFLSYWLLSSAGFGSDPDYYTSLPPVKGEHNFSVKTKGIFFKKSNGTHKYMSCH